MKKIILLLLLFSTVASAQINLIEPIVESSEMNLNQAKSFLNSQAFNNWGIKKLHLDSVMSSLAGDSVKVCICDTGEPSHPFLNAQIKGSSNFTTDPAVSDGHGHSTHVAGIVSEIAPKSELYFAKVLSDKGQGSSASVSNGIDWCISKGSNIINMSLGSPVSSPQIKASIDNAVNKGILVVAAAGNSGQSQDRNTMGYPARYEEALAIGSIKENLAVSQFSSSGEEGDIVAPGEKILSTWKDNKFIVLSGTSMAAPYVAGVAALHYQKYKTNEGVERLFEIGSTDIIPNGFDRISFWGYITPTDIFRDTLSNTDPPDENPDSKNPIGTWPLILGVVVVIIFISYTILKKKD